MINILLEGHNLTHNWLYGELRKHIKPSSRITVIPFSFRDSDAADSREWNKLYSKKGYITSALTKNFSYYGVDEENIRVVDYFNDTPQRAMNKIYSSDIIYFPGGLPHKIMERIAEFELYPILAAFDGVVMGNSAGALVQLDSYHVSPDRDYSEFGYYRGLPYIKGFDLEVHYDGSDVQEESIKRVLREKKKTVYATSLMQGGIVVDNGRIKLLGKVKEYRAK